MLHESSLARLSAVATDPAATLMDAALAVNVCIDEELDEATVVDAIVRLKEQYAGQGGSEPWTFLRAVGFGGLPPADVVAGSRIDTLLESRRGLPITLAVLVVELASSAGIEARGINFPGHFLVRVGQTLVDPLALEVRTESECLATLADDADRSAAFADAGPREVLLRMLNNLKVFHVGRAEFHRALEVVDCQLEVLPGHAGLVFEQGEYWLRLGSIQGARAAFRRIVAGDGVINDAAVRVAARRRLAELGDRSDTLH
ncbi:MAG: transglutaminase family protein [Pseudomonadales bacterium]